MMSNCENCCYWEKSNLDRGNCHRYPPARVFGTDDNGWSETGYPVTSGSDWCGEWMER